MDQMKVRFVMKISSILVIILFIDSSIITAQEYNQNILAVEPPRFFSQDPSPLRSRDSLRSPAYFDFLNTLYRHDKTKAELFKSESSPSFVSSPSSSSSSLSYKNPTNYAQFQNHQSSPSLPPLPVSFIRQKRAVIFRPLFVYRQQQVKRQRIRRF